MPRNSWCFLSVPSELPAGTRHVFCRSGHRLCTSPEPGDCLERKPVSVSIDGIDLGNTVYVDPVLGTVHDLSPCLYAGDRSEDHTRYHDLPLWDCPVLIINQDYLNMKTL